MNKPKVKVIKVAKYRDGGTTEYKDEFNRKYFQWFATGKVYSDFPKCGIGGTEPTNPEALEIPIELEIVKSFEPKPEPVNPNEYTREELISICEAAFVPQKQWNDRDSHSAQMGVAKAYMMLKNGCKFKIITQENRERDSSCVTDEDTIWIEFWVHTFGWFENGGDMDDEDNDGYKFASGEDFHYYLPTRKRLKKAAGGDWY
jgi:hypothetical protein